MVHSSTAQCEVPRGPEGPDGRRSDRAALDGFLVLDSESALLASNPFLTKILGYLREALLGRFRGIGFFAGSVHGDTGRLKTRGGRWALLAPAWSDRIRVLLADDHRIFRQALVALLRTQRNIDVVGEAADGAEAVELARTLKPEVVIMDVSMPNLNGIDATRQIVAEWPGMRIIGLSMHEDEAIAASMREAGAIDFVTKSGPPDALISAIRAASRSDLDGEAG